MMNHKELSFKVKTFNVNFNKCAVFDIRIYGSVGKNGNSKSAYGSI